MHPAGCSSRPAVKVEVLLDDQNIDLIEAGIDVALGVGELADSALTARKIWQSPRRVVGTSACF
jgi:DNA-binding transcriptional LysR family regulator